MSNFDKFMSNCSIYVKNHKFMSKWFRSRCDPVTSFMSKLLQEAKMNNLSVTNDIQNGNLGCRCDKRHSDLTKDR